MENEKLVYYVYNKLSINDFVIKNKEDLIQEGFLGLIKAQKTYDSSKGVKFATYAVMCIKNAMLLYIRSNKKHINNISLESIINEDTNLELIDILNDNHDYDSKLIIESILNSQELTEKEKQVFKKLSLGYKKIEIKKEFNVTQRFFKKLFLKIKVIINDFTN